MGSLSDSDDLGGIRGPKRARTPQSQQSRDDVVVIDSDSDDLGGTSVRVLPSAFHHTPKPTETPQSHSAKRRSRDVDILGDIDPESFVGAAPKQRRKKNTTIVGKTAPRKTHRPRRESDSDEHDEKALLEETLPSYLKNRRSGWVDRRQKLKLHGLMLPPEFDDLEFSDDDRLDRVEERPRFTSIKPINPYEDIELPKSVGIIPAPIAQWLRDYQVEGAAFLHEAFVYQRGVILGDDMGLGKTIQVISFLTAAFGKTGDARDDKRMRKVRRAGRDRWYPRVLIIAPGGLMKNWQNELDRWGWWTVYQYHGNAKHDALEAAHAGRLEIMLTTYTTYCNDASAINDIEWDCVIADECHQLRNTKAQTTQLMNEVNALCRIGLTGTAIQNKYEELWTILNWTSPGELGPLKLWKQTISEPLKAGQSHSATVAQLAKARNTAEDLVKHLLPRFFLRRMKSLIADQLPKKSDKVVFCPMTSLQQDAYSNFCESELLQAIIHASDPCHCGSGRTQGRCHFEEVDGISIRTALFPALMSLQKLSNHLGLLPPSSDSEQDKHDREIEFLKMAVPTEWQKMYTDRDSIRNYANQEYCGKWKVLKKMLKLWKENGDKVLVFSHSVRLLKMLHVLFRSTTTYTISYLDGSMSYDERQAVVDEFNSSPLQFVFLISTKAGGVGLNITSANKVVVADPNWNPAWDLQAQDRAYRIGQTRDVDVFRLVSAGTIEENIYARQIYKQQQANIGYNATAERRYFKGVQDKADGEIFGLANLLAPMGDRVALKDIVNKTNVAETRAGVEIAGLDLETSQEAEQDEDELINSLDSEKAMSELAASIIDEPGIRRHKAKAHAKKKDPIQAVLDAAGVSYIHENAEVIGSSKIEMQISSRARKAGGDDQWNSERVFAESQSQARPSDAQQTRVAYRYNPPEDVRKRQFCSMARFMGFDDVCQFALTVEGMTQQQRRGFLDRFYARRRETLSAG